MKKIKKNGIKDEKIIFLDEKGKYYFLKPNNKKEVHTNKGFFIFNENKDIFETNKGFKFFKVNYFRDKFKFIKKGPQTSHIKDLGLIFAKILPQKDWVMVEAGSGSGQVLSFFANYVKEIHSFEIKEEFFNIAKKNIEFLGLKNVYLYNKDLKECEVKANFVFLDLPEPWAYLEKIKEILERKGFLVIYFTTPRQLDLFMQKFQEKYKEFFVLEDIFEVVERPWELKKKERIIFCKPKTVILGFTAIVAILRKIK
jgi:tRNA (adenine57-N1/adenine58-N1)-methyltransferase